MRHERSLLRRRPDAGGLVLNLELPSEHDQGPEKGGLSGSPIGVEVGLSDTTCRYVRSRSRR